MTELKRYADYKDSGVDWLGRVPTDWSVEPLGRLFAERRETVSDSDYPALSVTREGVVPQLENVAKATDGDNRKLVRAGDFAINSRSDRKGSSGLADRDGSVSVITTVVTPRGLDPRFAHHLLRSLPFQEEFYRYGTGIVADLWSTRWTAMKSIRLPVPSRHEQQAIAVFLDRETAEVDAFIADQEKLITLLTERRAATISHAVTKGLNPSAPVANSGYPWIGCYPRHWSRGQGKHLGSLALGKMLQPAESAEASVRSRYLRAANVQPDGVLDLSSVKEMWFSCSEIVRLSLRRGDVVIVEGGVGGYGRAAYLEDGIADCAFQNSIIRLRPFDDQDGRFSAYFLLYLRNVGYIDMISNVASMPHYTLEKVAATPVLIPPVAEQRAIADFLDGELAEVDGAIADARQAIALSRERRAALIAAAVTGKIDVREHAHSGVA